MQNSVGIISVLLLKFIWLYASADWSSKFWHYKNANAFPIHIYTGK